jgi:Mor family transcriptional regulator
MKLCEIDKRMLDCGIDPHFYTEKEKLLTLKYAEAISKNTYSLPRTDLFSEARTNDLSKIESDAKEIALKYNELKKKYYKSHKSILRVIHRRLFLFFR